MAEPDHFMATLPPYQVSESLRPRIDELDLWGCIEDLRDRGYTVVRDAAPLSLLDELREVIHTFADRSEGDSRGIAAAMLLGRHPVVDRVVTLPKILAVAEASVGMGFRAGQIKGSVKRQGDPGLFMHADQNWIPAPFPEHNCVITFCIPCEGMTAEEGATRVVPGSHAQRRHPTPTETRSETVPIEVKKGGVAVWNGSVWHGAGVRRVDGTRTVLHATYQRLYTQPIDDYSYLLKDEEYMASAPEAMPGLLGERLFFGTAKPGSMVDMRKFGEATIRSKL